jgi:putative ATP-dependent endonuclease of OLD family
MTYLDETPFHQIGKGEQCVIKTNLALSHQKSQEANLILLEEPENHLSHTKLNELMKSVTERCGDKQVIISTHSSFVANKLGLENLILLNEQQTTRLSDLSIDTYDFFKKLPGYQTLRLLLCRKAVLVEGDSDELIFQRAYMDKNDGKLPIEDGIDVISVKLTFKRFLEIAVKINKKVAVITDNDSNYEVNITKKYKDYHDIDCIKIFADKRNEFNTLEPQFVDANSSNFENICKAIEIDYSNHNDFDKIRDYMIGNKTKWALNIFESETTFEYPQYIKDAVRWCNE